MTLRIALIGAGGISHAHVPAWLALGAEVTVFADEGAEQLSAHFGLTWVDSFDKAVQGADLVDICTPTPTHAGLALRAIAAGKDVICEKPVARRAADALRVLAAARAAGTRIYPGHVVRFYPEYIAAKQAVDAGRIGELGVLRFSRHGPGPHSPWFFDEHQSGGIVMDQMIHDLDAARWIAGEVTRVYARQNPPVSEDGSVPERVAAHVVLTHRSGAVSLIRGAWTDAGVDFTTSFDIAGSGGRLQYDSRSTSPLAENLAASDDESSYLPTMLDDDPFQTEFSAFLTALGGGGEAPVTYLDGIIAVGIAEAAVESLRTGAPVDFDQGSVLGSPATNPAAVSA